MYQTYSKWQDDLIRRDIPAKQPLIEKWIAEHKSKAFICRELCCKPATLDRYLNKMGIAYTGNKGSKGTNSSLRKSAQEFLCKGSLISSHKLKLKLLDNGLKEWRCEQCRNVEWLGEPIPIELHHINGDRFDNRIENLQLLCPNCHALTDNHAGRGSARVFSVASKT